MRLTSVRQILFLMAVPAVFGSCSDNMPPELMPVTSQTGYVGSKLDLILSAVDPDGDDLTFTFSCSTLNLQDRARMYHLPDKAIFSWTPLASDVGTHAIDIVVSDSSASDMETVIFTIKKGTSSNTAPIFRKPLGEGATLDLSEKKCITLEILIEDPDSLNVAIHQKPAILGSDLKTTGALSAEFNWCPTATQALTSIYLLKLRADDGDNPPVLKDYTILLRSAFPKNCPDSPKR